MPASADPSIVCIGVSPGNSPATEHKGLTIEEMSNESPSFGIPHKGLFYEDRKGYWKKVRDLSSQILQKIAPELTENERLSLVAHLNLSTGLSGKGTADLIEKDITEWVSWLLNTRWQPDIILLFGLSGIFGISKRTKNADINKIRDYWNHPEGLTIDWSKPDCEEKFDNYSYRKWNVKNKKGKRIQVISWPNHPSRHPFSNPAKWQESINRIPFNKEF